MKYVFAVVMVALLIVLLTWVGSQFVDCTNKGGVLVEGVLGYACIV